MSAGNGGGDTSPKAPSGSSGGSIPTGSLGDKPGDGGHSWCEPPEPGEYSHAWHDSGTLDSKKTGTSFVGGPVQPAVFRAFTLQRQPAEGGSFSRCTMAR
mmetsp:Transcript_30692/g.95853  ORF Transcript_30692/g.95853 Transcript_30692/m.95853 type:complete len:100 (-) Transcript_30692:312-611(-)